jgi:hypothetical protein
MNNTATISARSSDRKTFGFMPPPHEPATGPENSGPPAVPKAMVTTTVAENGHSVPSEKLSSAHKGMQVSPGLPGTNLPEIPPHKRGDDEHAGPVGGSPNQVDASQPSMAAANGVQASLTHVQVQAIKDLEGILARISHLDTEGWFQRPVTEAEAPNYYNIIKQPMCFQVRPGRVLRQWAGNPTIRWCCSCSIIRTSFAHSSPSCTEK